MKIKVDTDALASAFDVISRTAAPSSGNITCTTKKGKLSLSSMSDVSRCTIIVPCDVQGDGEFAVPFQSVKDAIKGHSEVSLTYANAMIQVASSKYSANLTTVDAIPMDDLPEEKTTEWRVTTDQATWMRKALKDVALKPTSILSSWMPAGVKLTSKGGFIACYDTQHIAWSNTKEITGDLECVLPIDTLQAVVEVFHKDAFVIEKAKSFVRVRNKLTTVALSVPSTDELPSLEQVQTKIKEAVKVKADSFQFSKQDLVRFLDNSRSVIAKERAELCVEGGKGIRLSIKTVQGEVKTVVDGTGGKPFKVDLEYMQELVGKAPEDILLNVVEGAFLSARLNSGSIMVALNQ